MSQRPTIPGKFVWFELVTADAKRAQAFYGEVLPWTVRPFPMGDSNYDMIYAGDTMIGGYAAVTSAGQAAHWLSYLSVQDVDASVKTAAAHGGKVIAGPFEAPGVGRMARIADPQGAQLCLFRSANGNAPDGEPPPGGWVWNELHTPNPQQALAFYEAVAGWSHRSMDMGPGGTYHIVSKDGVDRGGVTGHLMPGVSPHWLPYAFVEDVDATVARARKGGGTIPFGPEEIPGVGRSAVIIDPMEAMLALIKPLPRQK